MKKNILYLIIVMIVCSIINNVFMDLYNSGNTNYMVPYIPGLIIGSLFTTLYNIMFAK